MLSLRRYRDVLKVNWHVGFTAFGGPAVQFQTVRNNTGSDKLSGLPSTSFMNGLWSIYNGSTNQR